MRQAPHKFIEVDELVIGAGLAGLMYGLTAQSSGYQVAIMESHSKAGGYATNFMRNKRQYIFDCSQHKITGLGPNGNLRNALERLGLWEKLDFQYFEHLATIVVQGVQYPIPVQGSLAEEFLISCFPHESKGLRQLFSDIRTIGYQNYMFARMLLGEYQLDRNLLPESRQLQKLTTRQYFETLVRDPQLLDVLSAIALYLGTIAKEANALYFLHYLYAAFETSPGYLEGTSQKLSDTLAQEFKARGGILSFKDEVRQILVDEQEVSQVKTRKHTVLTKRVLATCSPHQVLDMLPEQCVSTQYRSKLDKLEFGWAHFAVNLVLDVPPAEAGLEQSEYLMVSESGDNLTADDYRADSRYHKLTLSATNYHLLNPGGGYVVQLVILDTADRWFSLEEADYLQRKTTIQDLLLERAYRVFPALKHHVVYKESSTPRTNFRFTSSPYGSAFGYKVLPNDNMRFLNTPLVDGLRFVGSWSTGAGYEAAMCLGFTHAHLQSKLRNNPIAQ